MKVTFDIDNADDAANAAAMCLALGDAFDLYEDPEKLREKLDEAEKVKVVTDKPVEEPAAAPVKETRGRRKKQPIVISNPHDAGTTDIHGNYTPAPPAGFNAEAARDELRDLAKKNGVVWMRDLLATHGAERLGDLTDSQVAHVVAVIHAVS